jgi:hypothetical protein
MTRPPARELCLAAAPAASAVLNVCLGCAADRHAVAAAGSGRRTDVATPWAVRAAAV